MAESCDAVVVGAGLMGAASAWSLARRGRSVLLVEQFETGHGHGSSHGSARIVRRAYGDALYTELTGRAFELWRELELSSSTSLLRMLGGLDFGPGRDVAAVAGHLAAAGVAHELLPADAAATRWPGMRFEGDVVFHAQAGVLDAAGAVSAFVAQAVAAGAVVRAPCAVTSLVPSDAGVTVGFADGSSVVAPVAVVAAGGWVAPLLDGLVDLPPIRVTEQTFVHLARVDPAAEPWPTVIHEAGGEAVYHLAGGHDGGAGDDRKIGMHDSGPVVSAGARVGVPDAALVDRLAAYAREWLPGLVPQPSSVGTCLYTMTPSEDFLIDRIGPLVVCSPCSGHGAKFAPLVGESVASLVSGDADVPDRFRLAAHASGLGGAVSL